MKKTLFCCACGAPANENTGRCIYGCTTELDSLRDETKQAESDYKALQVETSEVCSDLKAKLYLLVEAAERVLEEPYGCAFCHSGQLIDPTKNHNDDCGFAMLRRALGN